MIALQVLAFMLMVWARIHLGARSFHAGADPTQGGLITSGPYRFVRHPIYAAIFSFLVVSFIAHSSIQSGLLVLLACAFIAVRIAAEESLLIGMYPGYTEYAARVKRMVPFLF